MAAQRKCRVNLRPSKWEMNDNDTPRWWRERLAELEAEVCKSVVERPDVVLSVIGDRQTFKMVSGILKMNDAECDQLCIKALERERNERYEREKAEMEVRAREEMKSMKSKTSRSMDLRAFVGNGLFGDEEDEEDDLEEEDSSSDENVEEEEVVEEIRSISTEDSGNSVSNQPPGSKNDSSNNKSYDAYSNPYLNFLRRTPERAACWRPKKQYPLTGVYEADPHMGLLEKSAAVTNKIASDFVSWVRALGCPTPPGIDEKVLIDLFELDFDKPASRAVANRCQETLTMTPTMAKAWEFPEVDYRAFLREQVRLDIEAEQQQPKRLGFGTELDPDGRVEPPRNNTKAQWIGHRPEPDLASFSAVFDGLSHLESYIGFCKYLDRNPELGRPPCLKRWGVFTPADQLMSLSHTSLALAEGLAQVENSDSLTSQTINEDPMSSWSASTTNI